MDTPTSLGLWLRQRRRALDLTQEELAWCAGCSLSAIRKIEADERRPSRQVAELLADCLEISLEDRPTFLKIARAELRVDRLSEVSSAPLLPRTPAPLPTLPTPPTPLLGREHELASITRLLQNPQCRLLTLIGFGGVGKTRLAIEAAANQREAFADGVYFVPLAPVSASEFIVPTVADAIGFTFYAPADPQAQLLNYLREKHLLLTLDNFEHLLPTVVSTGQESDTASVELLVSLLRQAPGVKVLVTSRERLNIQGEWVFEVQGLPVPLNDQVGELESYSAVMLFLQSAQRAQVGFGLTPEERPAVARICQLVEGMPLGLELAAAWVRALSCREIAQEIERNLDFLTASLRDVPERQRSLRAVFEHSWKLLTEAEQAVFKRMSVFQGSFQRAAAERVTDASLTILSSLVDKSLLKHTPAGRYEIHELLRQFCQEKLGEGAGEEERTRDHHCRYFADFLHEREPDLKGGREKEGLAEIEVEIDNVRAGWGWAVAQRDEGALENSLESLASFYAIRGWYQEGREAFGRAAEALRETEPEGEKGSLLGKVLAEQGRMCNHLGLYEQAKELLEESLAICRRLGSQKEMAYAYRVLGDIAIHRGVLAEAEPLYQESVALYKAIGDQDGVMISLNQLGWAALKQGKMEEAEAYLEESLALLRAKGLRRKIVWALMDLGELALGLGRYDEAIQHCRESVAISKELGYPYGLAFSLNDLGWMVRDLGAYQEAKQYFHESLTVYQTLGHQRGIGWSLAMLGYIAILLDEPTEAEAYLQESHASCQALGDEKETWWCRCVQGELALVRGAYAQAEEHFQKSMALFKDIGDIGVSWGVAWSLNGLGKTACAMGAYQESQQYFQKALRAALAVPSIPEALDVLMGVATLLATSGKREQAVGLLAIPLHHSASRQISKDRAARLLAALEAVLPPEVFAAARERGRARTVEEVVADILAQTG